MTDELETAGPSATVPRIGLGDRPAVEQRIEHATHSPSAEAQAIAQWIRLLPLGNIGQELHDPHAVGWHALTTGRAWRVSQDSPFSFHGFELLPLSAVTNIHDPALARTMAIINTPYEYYTRLTDRQQDVFMSFTCHLLPQKASRQRQLPGASIRGARVREKRRARNKTESKRRALELLFPWCLCGK